MSIPTLQRSIPGPEDIQRFLFDCGLVLLTRTNRESSSVVMSGYLDGGSIFDPDEKLGLALFTSQALMRGTEEHTHEEIFEALESAGASLGFGAGVHSVSFSGRALAEDLRLLLGKLVECLRKPVFPADHLERLRTQMLTSLAIRAQNTEDLASMAFDRVVFGKHPYSRPEDGFEHTVAAITRKDILDFHRQNYGPCGMVMAVVGAIEPSQVYEQVQDAFSDWENTQPRKMIDYPPLAPLPSVYREHIPLPDKFQTDLVLGGLGPVRKSPDFPPALLGNHILGQFGMMGRIGKVVRERAGLAYYASSSLDSSLAGGYWDVTAGVNPENLSRAIDLILEELIRFTHEEVTPEELSDSQSNLIGQLPLSLESNLGVAGALVHLERFQLGLDYYQRYPDMIRQVTAQHILEVVRAYWKTDQLAIISCGPELQGT